LYRALSACELNVLKLKQAACGRLGRISYKFLKILLFHAAFYRQMINFAMPVVLFQRGKSQTQADFYA
jgi:hypothetical protein